MKPNQVDSHNEQLLRDTVYNYERLAPTSSLSESTITLDMNGRKRLRLQRRKAIYKVGDHVRLSKYRQTFEKGYTPNYTTEVFIIRKVRYNTDPITYFLKDYQNNEIKGSVYAEELTHVENPNVYLIEKIIRRNSNGKVLVKWLGFDSSHNSWISKKDII